MDIYAGRLREHALSGKLLEVFQKYDIKKDGKVNIQGLRSVLKELEVNSESRGQPEQVS